MNFIFHHLPFFFATKLKGNAATRVVKEIESISYDSVILLEAVIHFNLEDHRKGFQVVYP